MWSQLKKALLAAGFVAIGSLAQATERVALVIGNSAYKDQPPLPNPTNDADDVSAMLRKLGFEVIEGLDADRDSFKDKINEFDKKLKGGQVALFYYSGHGMQVEGKSYAIPVDARIAKPEDLDQAGIDIADIIKIMGRKDITSIVVLDACRNNPFSTELARALRITTRGGENPFKLATDIKAPSDPFIVYSTDQGNVAQDGEGRNSPFTKAFLKHAPTRGMVIEKVAREIRTDVALETGSKQVPHFAGLPGRDVYLGGEPDPVMQQAVLKSDENPVDGTSSLRQAALPVPSDSGKSAAPQPVPVPVEDDGAKCDRLTSDVEDPLRDKSLQVVHFVTDEEAIPACQKAVSQRPTLLRYQNELGRALFDAGRLEEAFKVWSKAASLSSGYAINQVGYMIYRGVGGASKDYGRALPWFEKAARLGMLQGSANAAYIYAHGIGVPKDTAKALELLNKGISQNNATSMVNLGDLYHYGYGVPKDRAKAQELYEQAAKLESGSAMTALGQLALESDKDIKPNFDEARRWLIKSASYDTPEAMSTLGFLYLQGKAGVPTDYKIARDWFNRGIRLKDASSYAGLGLIYRDGLGVDKDMAKARDYFEQAAAQDDTGAMRELARLYKEGDLGAPDKAKAKEWLEKAVALDDDLARQELAQDAKPETPAETCDRLASAETDPLRLKNAKPVASIRSPDAVIAACAAAWKAAPQTLRFANQLGRGYIDAERYADAMTLYQQAAKGNSAFATLWIGNFYDRGLGVKQDHKAGFEWYKKAASLGSLDGYFNMAVAYQNGDGVPKDLTKAKQNFEKAAAMGSATAMTQLCLAHYNGAGTPVDFSLARSWCEKAAKLDDTDAKRLLGNIYEYGNGITQDGAQARLWYQQAAADGDLKAKWRLANAYLNGIGGEQDLQKARGLLLEAAGAENVEAMNMLAQTLLAGVFTKIDADEGRVGGEEEARKWYQKAAEKDDNGAKSWLANFAPGGNGDLSKGPICDANAGSTENPLYNPAVPPPAEVDPVKAIPACEAALAASLPLRADAPDGLRYADELALAYNAAGRYFDAVRVFKAAASAGSSYATTWVGVLYDRGRGGLLKNSDEAASWYEKAAMTQNPAAMYNLGIYWLDRFYDKKEPEKAAKLAREWLTKAAETGHDDALYQLALLDKDGVGAEASTEKFMDGLKKAADAGSADALYQYGVALAHGDNVAKDEAKARILLKKAVDRGNIDANSSLGVMYVMGSGGPKQVSEGKALIEKAAAQGKINALVAMANGYEFGFFGPINKAEARKWYQKAADLGDTDSAEKLRAAK